MDRRLLKHFVSAFPSPIASWGSEFGVCQGCRDFSAFVGKHSVIEVIVVGQVGPERLCIRGFAIEWFRRGS